MANQDSLTKQIKRQRQLRESVAAAAQKPAPHEAELIAEIEACWRERDGLTEGKL